jgi:hypothetical protein
MKRPFLLVVPLVALCGTPTAWADEAPAFSIGSKPAWFLTAGPNVGGTVVTADRGWYVGGEASLVRLREGNYMGLYGDGYYDFGARRTYTTAGIELGRRFVGIDAGVAARLGGERVEWGPTGRLFVTVGILAIYARYAYFIDALRSGDEHVIQIGALIKIPLVAWGGS